MATDPGIQQEKMLVFQVSITCSTPEFCKERFFTSPLLIFSIYSAATSHNPQLSVYFPVNIRPDVIMLNLKPKLYLKCNNF